MKEAFRMIIDQAKIMKPSKEDRVCILNDIVCAINPEFSILKRIYLGYESGIRFNNNYNETKIFLTKNIDFEISPVTFDVTGTSYVLSNQTYFDIGIRNLLSYAEASFSRNPTTVENYDLLSNETFKNILSHNIIYGVDPVRVDNYVMFLSPNMLPINKKDTCFVSIADSGCGVFVSRFVISKPKEPDIEIYITFLNVM
jgi:hypothetical protein